MVAINHFNCPTIDRVADSVKSQIIFFLYLTCSSMIGLTVVLLVVFFGNYWFIVDPTSFIIICRKKKGKRKVQGVPQSQTAALHRPQEKEEVNTPTSVLSLYVEVNTPTSVSSLYVEVNTFGLNIFYFPNIT